MGISCKVPIIPEANEVHSLPCNTFTTAVDDQAMSFLIDVITANLRASILARAYANNHHGICKDDAIVKTLSVIGLPCINLRIRHDGTLSIIIIIVASFTMSVTKFPRSATMESFLGTKGERVGNQNSLETLKRKPQK
ncbi:hypothetical protein VNO77_04485 [Canavalia gladiata]|uniref:Uncharacterized protein n=1 Tax=Canavalia gladiata TaxID=3824 RepID=A0AAN9R942_CANGL